MHEQYLSQKYPFISAGHQLKGNERQNYIPGNHIFMRRLSLGVV